MKTITIVRLHLFQVTLSTTFTRRGSKGGILDTQIRRSWAKQETTSYSHSHFTRELHVALDASNREIFHLCICPHTKQIHIPILKCLVPNVVEKKPIIVGRNEGFQEP